MQTFLRSFLVTLLVSIIITVVFWYLGLAKHLWPAHPMLATAIVAAISAIVADRLTRQPRTQNSAPK